MKLINYLKRRNSILIILIAIGFITLLLIGGGQHSSNTENIPQNTTAQKPHTHHQMWTCSMHPQIRLTNSGKCPICGMTLVPIEEKNDNTPQTIIKMSPAAIKLSNIQTTVVKRVKFQKIIRLNGRVLSDERYVFNQTSHIKGRIESLKINYTGEYIKKGQVIALVYSPELVVSQKELFEAYNVRETQPRLYKSAIQKLKNWKLNTFQIEKILKKKHPQENFPILSDLNGVVLSKNINLGDHVSEGTVLFKVADLSKLWIVFDLYEDDIPWVHLNNKVTYTFKSFPGEEFEGKINFIDPVITPETRVAKARINIENRAYRFKPDMFVLGQVRSISKTSKRSIIIPKSAVLWTGLRSIVYVKSGDTGFMMREVLLGADVGDGYVILKGLEEGDQVVTNGVFNIDAASQILGNTSMMYRK